MDRTTNVDEAIVRSNPWHFIKVEPLPDFRLRIQFADGNAGEEDLRHLIFGRDGTVFVPLRDPEVFNHPYIVHGAVTWDCGVDLAPDAMWERITGRYGEACPQARTES